MLILIRIPLYLVLRKCHLSFLLYRVDNDSPRRELSLCDVALNNGLHCSPVLKVGLLFCIMLF